MTKAETNTERENLVVRNIHDNEGHTERVIMEESETIATVETWLKDNDFSDMMKKEGIVRTGQSYGNRIEVQIDTRDGRVICCTERLNQYSAEDSFFITLASHAEIDINDEDILGDEYMLDLTTDTIRAGILENCNDDELAHFLENGGILANEDGTYPVTYWVAQENNDLVDIESWFNNFSSVKYEDALSEYLDWELEMVGEDWIDRIFSHYQEIRDMQILHENN